MIHELHLSRRSTAGVFALTLLIVAFASGAGAAYNSSLHWKTLSTEHFDVHYHEGAEWTARQVAQIAEEVYPHITGLYRYEPSRCNFVILDTQDYANGAAYFYDNKVEIWATNLEFGYRGTTQWLRNVVTHEFTHVVSIQASMKMPLQIPAIYFQALTFEDEKRPDVINGYPNFIGTYPITGFVVPPWWAEGVAQYQSPTRQYDCWDSHRDMILRASFVDDEMLTYDEMGFFGHKSNGNEMVYDHGYGLVRYIASTYGSEAVRRVSESLGKWDRLTIDGALKDVTGKSGKALYDDWRGYLKKRYDEQLAPVYANRREGWVLSDAGFKTHSPVYSPDGTRVAFLSNKGSDYSATSLYIANSDGKEMKRIEGPVSSRPSFSPDGGSLLYASHKKSDKYGAMLSDVFVYDLEKKKAQRITKKLRASDPSYSPGGERIVCVLNGDGTHRLAVMNADGENMKILLEQEKGTQFYGPQFSPDGRRILFGIFTNGTRDIASIDSDGGDFRYVLKTSNDERDARYASDGRSIVFASDRSGIFNIYRLEVDTGEVSQLTNVVGGAFTPDMSRSTGAVVYSGFNGKGYNVAVLDPGEPVGRLGIDEYAMRSAGAFDECGDLKTRPGDVAGGTVSFDESSFVSADVAGGNVDEAGSLDGSPVSNGADLPVSAESLTGIGESPVQVSEPHDYESAFGEWQVYPRVVIWDGTPRFGAFITTNEVLEKQTFFAAGSYGTDGDFDAYLSFELRRLFPVLFMEYFRVRQGYDDEVDIDDLLYFLDIRYDLWVADLGMRFEFADPYGAFYRNDLSFWYSHAEYNIHINPTYRDLAQPELGLIPDYAVGWKYYVGNEFYLQYFFKAIVPSLDGDINPRGGRSLRARVMYAIDDLHDGDFAYGFQATYEENRYGHYTLDYSEYVGMPWWRHSLQVRLLGEYIDKKVDDFFWSYIGGMDGIRGYTFFTLGGRGAALASATYRFPIWRRINKQLSWLTFKDIYGGAFFEIANAWDHAGFEDQAYKRSAGYELRLNLGSFYVYPTTVSITGAYALDEAIFRNPLFDIEVVHEPQWRHYMTLGFTF